MAANYGWKKELPNDWKTIVVVSDSDGESDPDIIILNDSPSAESKYVTLPQ